jgi:hypothetical protein
MILRATPRNRPGFDSATALLDLRSKFDGRQTKCVSGYSAITPLKINDLRIIQFE